MFSYNICLRKSDNRIKRLKERILLLPSLTQKERKELSHFVLIDDVVYKIKHELNKTDYLVYIPKSLRKMVCQANHEDITKGHTGREQRDFLFCQHG